MNSSTKTAWQNIFEQCKIVDVVARRGYFDITAEAIKRMSGKEPRIMAKWDSVQSVPDVFIRNNLGLISISRKGYRIAPFNIFHKIETDALTSAKIQSREIPSWMLSLGAGFGERSEPGLLSSCYAAGIISEYANVARSEVLPGIFGRLSTDKMYFTIEGIGARSGRRIPISCDGIQIEIDASYESPESMLIIEAKNCLLEDFNLRQLYFPWRYLKDKISKVIRPMFIMRSNEIISVCEYEFMEASEIDSIRLVSANRYSFAETEITTTDLSDVLHSIRRPLKANGKTFPQADGIDLVIDLCERLRDSSADADDIAERLNYVHRQGQYYVGAADFLGLVEKQGRSDYLLTKDGLRIFNLPYKKRQLEIAKRFLQYRVFARCLDFSFKMAELPGIAQVAKWIKEDGWPMNETTAYRRASTVVGWVRWLINLTQSN